MLQMKDYSLKKKVINSKDKHDLNMHRLCLCNYSHCQKVETKVPHCGFKKAEASQGLMIFGLNPPFELRKLGKLQMQMYYWLTI